MSKELFKHFYVDEVAEFQELDGCGTFCEPVHTFGPEQHPEDDPQFIGRFFSVYGKIPAPSNEEAARGVPGGVEAIYDSQDRKAADELCDWLNSVLKRAGIYAE